MSDTNELRKDAKTLRDFHGFTFAADRIDAAADEIARLRQQADLDRSAILQYQRQVEGLERDKANLIRQAEQQAQEARTQRAIVLEIGGLVGCDKDYEMVPAVRDYIIAMKQRLAAQPVAVEQEPEKHTVDGAYRVWFCHPRDSDRSPRAAFEAGFRWWQTVAPLYTAPPAQARPIDAIQERQDGYMAGFVRAGFECRNADVTALCGEPQYLKWMADDLSEPPTGVEPLLWRAGYEAGKAAARPFVPARMTLEDAPDDYEDGDSADSYAAGWNDCIETMLAAPAAQSEEG